MCGTGLPASGPSSRTTTPVVSVTQRVETPADRNLTSAAQTQPVRLQNVATSDKNTNSQLQKKSSTKVSRPGSSNDVIKGRRQPSDTANESSVTTRPDRDVSAAVTKQHKDFTVDIRTPSQPPPQQLPVADVCQPSSEFGGGRLQEPSPVCETAQSSSHIKAEEFLQVSSLSKSFVSKHFVIEVVSQSHMYRMGQQNGHFWYLITLRRLMGERRVIC